MGEATGRQSKLGSFLADKCTLNYYEKNGFAYLFKDEEQETASSRMKLPLKTRYMYFDLIEVIRK